MLAPASSIGPKLIGWDGRDRGRSRSHPTLVSGPRFLTEKDGGPDLSGGFWGRGRDRGRALLIGEQAQFLSGLRLTEYEVFVKLY